MKYSLNPHIFVFGKTINKPKISISFLSYLLRGKQNILIDTVPDRAAEAYIQDIESVLPVSQIDALILNHSEEDHSGALQAVLDRHPNLPVYCTPATKERLQEKYPSADFRVVQHGESLTLGDYTFQFIHTPGLHWPDNMVTWLASEGILFSNDLFGQYLAEETPVDEGYTKEAILKGAEPYLKRFLHRLRLKIRPSSPISPPCRSRQSQPAMVSSCRTNGRLSVNFMFQRCSNKYFVS